MSLSRRGFLVATIGAGTGLQWLAAGASARPAASRERRFHYSVSVELDGAPAT